MPTPFRRTEEELKMQLVWAGARAAMEANNYKNQRGGIQVKSNWKQFSWVMRWFMRFCKLTGIFNRGFKNARDIKLKNLNYTFANLPYEFNDFKILHLTDLHLDTYSELTNDIIQNLPEDDYDIAVLTGDYRYNTKGGIQCVEKDLKKVLKSLHPRIGTFVTLGNHDTHLFFSSIEEEGARILCNETVELNRNGEKIYITGTDDPYSYFTDQQIVELEKERKGFKIALIHSPGLLDIAAQNNYSLYLCGHTHGGQVCLPGGIPIITHAQVDRKYAKGKWTYMGMNGYTSNGCGVSGVPLRFYTRSEIGMITLKSAQSKKTQRQTEEFAIASS